MALLTAAQRREAAREYADEVYVRPNKTANLSGTDLVAAVIKVDTFAESIEAAFNAALPEAYRGTATTQEKTILFQIVIGKRRGL